MGAYKRRINGKSKLRSERQINDIGSGMNNSSCLNEIKDGYRAG